MPARATAAPGQHVSQRAETKQKWKDDRQGSFFKEKVKAWTSAKDGRDVFGAFTTLDGLRRQHYPLTDSTKTRPVNGNPVAVFECNNKVLLPDGSIDPRCLGFIVGPWQNAAEHRHYEGHKLIATIWGKRQGKDHNKENAGCALAIERGLKHSEEILRRRVHFADDICYDADLCEPLSDDELDELGFEEFGILDLLLELSDQHLPPSLCNGRIATLQLIRENVIGRVDASEKDRLVPIASAIYTALSSFSSNHPDISDYDLDRWYYSTKSINAFKLRLQPTQTQPIYINTHNCAAETKRPKDFIGPFGSFDQLPGKFQALIWLHEFLAALDDVAAPPAGPFTSAVFATVAQKPIFSWHAAGVVFPAPLPPQPASIFATPVPQPATNIATLIPPMSDSTPAQRSTDDTPSSTSTSKRDGQTALEENDEEAKKRRKRGG